MQRVTFRSLAYYQFEALIPGTVHGMFTRLGGHSRPPWASLNTGGSVGDDPAAVEANHRLTCQALGLDVEDLVSCVQVHGAEVGVVDERDRGTARPGTDALITAAPGLWLMLRFADCTPVLLHDPVRRVVGLAHGGWRGIAAGVARKTVAAMRDAYGCRPADLIAGVGPAIGPCCYEVGEDVAEAIGQAFPAAPSLLSPRANGRWHLDLWSAARLQLARAGVRQVHVSGVCTACHTKEWYSHRAERGRTGRHAVLIGLEK